MRGDCESLAAGLGLAVDFHSADGAQALYDAVLRGCRESAALIVDPGSAPDAALTAAYRYALRVTADRTLPFVELRQTNIFAGAAETGVTLHEAVGRMGLIAGFGKAGYELAIRAIARRLNGGTEEISCGCSSRHSCGCTPTAVLHQRPEPEPARHARAGNLRQRHAGGSRGAMPRGRRAGGLRCRLPAIQPRRPARRLDPGGDRRDRCHHHQCRGLYAYVDRDPRRIARL